MSETDDTDDLLLIPPDFFVVDPDLQEPYVIGPYYDVVDSLITQVNKLENRINYIENTSETSLVSKSLDYSINSQTDQSNLMSGVRKYSSTDEINKVTRDRNTDSTQSTPQKPQTRYKLSPVSSSGFDRFSPHKVKQHNASLRPRHYKSPNRPPYSGENAASPTKHESKKEILEEIDKYISDLQARKKEIDGKKQAASSHRQEGSANLLNLNLHDLDLMLKKVEAQENDFDAKETYERRSNAERTWQCGDNKNSVPDRGFHIRDAMYDGKSKENEQIPSTSDLSTCNESYVERTDSVSSSSESTQLTALPIGNRLAAGRDNISTNVLYKRQSHSINNNFNQPTASRDYRRVRRNILYPEHENLHTEDTNNARLLSLSNLWNRGDRSADYTSKDKYLEKLEEEKLRRQHCELLIQQLQSKSLELQEKLAVAVEVDETKDHAILRFHNAWEQIAVRLQSLTKERNELELEIKDMQVRSATDLAEAAKKVARFESEASKALHLAHNSQEKLANVEKSHTELINENQSLAVKVCEVQANYECEIEKNKNLAEIVAQKEIELNESKNVLNDARNEIGQSKRAVELCQAELTSMKTQYTQLEISINEKEDTIKELKRQNQNLLSDIDTHKKIEKGLQQDLNKAKELNDKNKFELRNFYQDQVEIVVRDKLKEFQSQLDRAETSLQDELKKREMTIAKSAAMHIHEITDKHTLEVKLIEEKHREEIRLYQVQLSQAQQHIDNLQYRLKEQQQRRSDIARQLHKVMEAQWLEALRIINSSKSPVSQDQDVTINQLNVLKSKSHNNLDELLSVDAKDSRCERDFKSNKPSSVPPLNFGPSTSSVGGNENSVYTQDMETPVSSRSRNKQQIEIELQKYVQMLLNKPPGNPMCDPQKETNSKDTNGDSAVYDAAWQPPVLDENKSVRPSVRDKKLKPPWK